MVESAIAELSAASKQVLIATNDSLVAKTHVIVSLLLISEANLVHIVLVL